MVMCALRFEPSMPLLTHAVCSIGPRSRRWRLSRRWAFSADSSSSRSSSLSKCILIMLLFVPVLTDVVQLTEVDAPHGLLLALAILSATLLALGVLRHYLDIYIHRSVRGISFWFVALDAAGDLTSLISVGAPLALRAATIAATDERPSQPWSDLLTMLALQSMPLSSGSGSASCSAASCTICARGYLRDRPGRMYKTGRRTRTRWMRARRRAASFILHSPALGRKRCSYECGCAGRAPSQSREAVQPRACPFPSTRDDSKHEDEST